MKTRYLIIGQGLAGSILAYRLASKGHAVHIIDNRLTHAASAIRNGIIAPITGNRFAKSWHDLSVQESAVSFYSEVESLLNSTFITEKPMVRFIFNDFELDNYTHKSTKEEFRLHFKKPFSDRLEHPDFNHSYGGFSLEPTFSVCISQLLETLKGYLIKHADYREEVFDHSLINHTNTDQNLIYKDIHATHIIFCEGHQINQNPFFNTLPFRHVKGEVLDIYCEDLDDTTIYSNGKWLLPLGDNHFVFGATYDRLDLTHDVTPLGRDTLTRLLSEFLKHPFTVTGHRTGIRPSTTDFKPIIGPHPEFSNMLVFNGFGSKGLSLIPEFSKYLYDFLITNSPLDKQISVSRYKHLLKTKKTA